MTGILGSANLLNGPPQAIYVNNKNSATIITVNFCNRNPERSSLIRLAVSSTESPANTDWIEYDTEIPANGVLERTGIWVNSGQYIVVRSNMPNVNVVAWGATKGSTISVPSLSVPTIGTVSWVTAASLTSVTTGTPTTFYLSAIDSNGGTVFYSLASGSSLPSGIGLSSTGVLEGTFQSNSTFNFTITASNGVNTANRTFLITTTSPPVVYENLTFTGITATLTVTGNSTQSVNIFKTSGNTSLWDAQAYSNIGYLAPLTLEFKKQAATTDNSLSYAMIGLDPNPVADVSFTSIDHASFPYRTNAYEVYNDGVLVLTGAAWNSLNKFYIVFNTDGSIKHYNESTLLYTGFGPINTPRFIDLSIRSVDAVFGGFSEIRLTKRIWNGTSYI